MDLKVACTNILTQMASVIENIDDNNFVKSCASLSGSTIGQHCRHAIEFFECLAKGFEEGVICYDNRDHDRNIETSRVLALEVISRIKSFVKSSRLERQLTLEVSYDSQNREVQKVASNMARELVYNIEHVVHHMALVKIGLKELLPDLDLPDDFGVAVSTIRYQRSEV